MTEILDIRLLHQCRICLSCGDEMVNIFNKADSRPIFAIFEQILGVPVSTSDGLSRFLCGDCDNKLTEAIQLRQQAEESAWKLVRQCRICMKQKCVEVDIFSDVLEYPDGKKEHLLEVFQKSIGISVSVDDGLGRNLCKECVERLKQITSLRYDAQHSYQTIKGNHKPNENEENEQILMDLMTQEEPDYDGSSMPEILTDSDRRDDVDPDQLDENDSIVDEYCNYSDGNNTNEMQDPEEVIIFSTSQTFSPKSKNDVTLSEYKCMKCPEIFTSIKEFKEHNSVHKLVKKYTCKKCEQEFVGEKVYKEHYLVVHGSDRPFICNICNKSFNAMGNLKRHIFTHSGEKPFICEVCSKAFRSKNELQTHMLTHSTERPFVCDVCAKTFSQKSALRSHTRVHNDAKPFTCEYCQNNFRTSVSLKSHIRIHTGEMPYTCKYCSRRFRAAITLIRHVRTHTNEKPFVCEFCSKSFIQEGNLKTHLRTHTKEQPFSCEICGRKFTQKSNYTNHMRIHRNIRPHVCPVCNKGFTVARDCREHVAAAHSEERAHICEFCGKGFKIYRHLRHHKKRCTNKGTAIAENVEEVYIDEKDVEEVYIDEEALAEICE